jgi:hypothetical protein
MKQRKTLKSGYEIYNFSNSIADVESGYIDCVNCRKLYHVSCAGMGVSLISILNKNNSTSMTSKLEALFVRQANGELKKIW